MSYVMCTPRGVVWFRSQPEYRSDASHLCIQQCTVDTLPRREEDNQDVVTNFFT